VKWQFIPRRESRDESIGKSYLSEKSLSVQVDRSEHEVALAEGSESKRIGNRIRLLVIDSGSSLLIKSGGCELRERDQQIVTVDEVLPLARQRYVFETQFPQVNNDSS
jgi:hypothetical protein